jgi:hypothetical protein
MYNFTTPAFKAALIQSHTMVCKIEVLDQGDLVLANLPIIDGSVTASRDGNIRRSATLTVAGEEYVPEEITDLLHPLSSHEFKVFRGIRFADGTEEFVPLGIFGIEDTDIEDDGDQLTVSIKGFDRSKQIQRNKWTRPYFVEEGLNYGEAIKAMILNRRPSTQFAFTYIDEITPPMIFGSSGLNSGGDPWSDVVGLAESLGMQIYFNVEGYCRIQKEPDPSTAPVAWEFKEGEEATILSATRGLTRENVYNHVVAFAAGSSLADPVRIDVVDDDPTSPTYYLGSFGDVPTYYRSTTISSVSQTTEAAQALLRKSLGTPEQISFNHIVVPMLQVGDTVRIRNTRMGLDQKHIIDKITIPLTHSGSASAQTRQRQV